MQRLYCGSRKQRSVQNLMSLFLSWVTHRAGRRVAPSRVTALWDRPELIPSSKGLSLGILGGCDTHPVQGPPAGTCPSVAGNEGTRLARPALLKGEKARGWKSAREDRIPKGKGARHRGTTHRETPAGPAEGGRPQPVLNPAPL